VISHLSDKDDIGVLAHDVPERIRVAFRVDADLALIDDALLVLVKNLDGVFDRDDMSRVG
jgi:hypothetical protein